MSRKRKAPALGQSAKAARDIATRAESERRRERSASVEPRSSVAIAPRLLRRLGDAATYLGESSYALAERLLAMALRDFEQREPASPALPVTPAVDPGGRLGVHVARGAGRARMSSLMVRRGTKDRLYLEAARLRTTQTELVSEAITVGLRQLRAGEAERLGNPLFDWPVRGGKGA